MRCLLGVRAEQKEEERREKVKKYVLTVVATCIVCWGKVVLIVGELCPSVGSESIVCLSLQPMR